MIKRHLDSTIKPLIIFLRQCRTLATPMGNVIRFLKPRIIIGIEGGSVENVKDKKQEQ